MAQFDIISAAVNAYKLAWAERAYVMRILVVPLFVKLLCFTLAINYAPEPANSLRFTMIMLPALLVEGWMLSHLIRLVAFGQRWPFKPTGNLEADLAVLKVRARGVLSGMIVFVLVNMGLGFLMAVVGTYVMPYVPQDGNTDAMEIPSHIAFLSFLMLGIIFWGFRLMWMYIPAAIGIDLKDYLIKIRGFATSFHMIGLWLLCFMPIFFALRVFAGLIQGVFGSSEIGAFLMLVVTVLSDSIKGIIITFALSFIFVDLFKSKKE